MAFFISTQSNFFLAFKSGHLPGRVNLDRWVPLTPESPGQENRIASLEFHTSISAPQTWTIIRFYHHLWPAPLSESLAAPGWESNTSCVRRLVRTYRNVSQCPFFA